MSVHTYYTPAKAGHDREALIYTGPPQDRPVLTVANSSKWYDIFRVMPDGTVEEVTDYWDRGGEWSDHVPAPSTCYPYARAVGAVWCQVSLDAITGRYARDILAACTATDIPWLPHESDND